MVLELLDKAEQEVYRCTICGSTKFFWEPYWNTFTK